MSDKPVLLLPGPSSSRAAADIFGDSYECASWASGDYFGERAEESRALTNGALAGYNGRRIDIWQAPSFAALIDCASVVQDLLKQQCIVRVIRLREGDAMDPYAAKAAGLDKWELLQWARGHVVPAADFLIEAEATAARALIDAAPTTQELEHRRTPDTHAGTSVAESRDPAGVRRGHPRSGQDGAPPSGDQLEADGSVFVSWERLGLETNQNGMPHAHLANVQRVLAMHPKLTGKIWYDEFHGRIFQTLFQPEPAEWQDHHDTRLTVWLQAELKLHKMGHMVVQRAVDEFARQHVRNEVRDWMDGLAWDGTERLETFLADAFGTPQNPYYASVGRGWLVGMVARTYEPGCKVDTMPVFEGPQGIHKSTALSILGGKWYSEMHEDITSKDFLQSLPGKLLIEISELHAFRRAEVDRIKGIISNPSDRYRESYGRRSADHPRRGVWGGTTNRDDWNQDDTGARRFWPVACSSISLDYLRENREQLFAEAVALYSRVPRGTSPADRLVAGAAWWDVDKSTAKIEQEKRRDADEWTDAVLRWAENFKEVTVGDILAQVLEMPLIDRGKAEQMRIASILRLAGYQKADRWVNNKSVRFWFKPIKK